MPRPLIMPPIGGFLPLALTELPAAAVTPWQLWTNGTRCAVAFHNARSALAWLLRQKQIARLLVPAYVCVEVAEAARSAGAEVHFYGVGEALAPDTAAIARGARRGDAVLGIDYFGSSQPATFLALVKERRDLLWIEDRAQAFAPAGEAWGDWVLYSPRKVLGVPDGGLLVSYRETLSPPDCAELYDLSFMAPSLERFEDAAETGNDRWFPRYREVEARAAVSLAKMSRLTATLLARLDATKVADKRRGNRAILAAAFSTIALDPPGADGRDVPFGYPIRLRNAAEVAARLAKQGIFCARHWSTLPSDPSIFAGEHRLAQSTLTLPCDQRYGKDEMNGLVEIVAAHLA